MIQKSVDFALRNRFLVMAVGIQPRFLRANRKCRKLGANDVAPVFQGGPSLQARQVATGHHDVGQTWRRPIEIRMVKPQGVHDFMKTNAVKIRGAVIGIAVSDSGIPSLT